MTTQRTIETPTDDIIDVVSDIVDQGIVMPRHSDALAAAAERSNQAEARCTFCNAIGSFPHTCKTPDTELVATFRPEADAGEVSIVISATSMENLWWQIDGWADDDLEGVIGIVTIARKPVGHVASLPEHPGW